MCVAAGLTFPAAFFISPAIARRIAVAILFAVSLAACLPRPRGGRSDCECDDQYQRFHFLPSFSLRYGAV
jgi:hypothetical protein